MFIFLALGSCIYKGSCVFAQTDQVSTQLQAANTAVDQAFNAVLAAEEAGANVTNLLNQLNDASSLLAQAENAYRTGDNDTAIKDANAVLPIAQQVTGQAQQAQTREETSLASIQSAFWTNIIISVIAVAVFLLALILVWRLFKRNYIKSLSEAKPEATVQ